MQEQEIRGLLAEVAAGRRSRRAFLQRLALAGIAAPMASLLLADAGLAQLAAPLPPYKPTKRGGGGPLKLLLWQGPTLLNPHIRHRPPRTRKARASSTSRWRTGTPMASSCRCWPPRSPAATNGGLSPDGRSVTWKLKKGVTWHDGQPFTADDVIFNWQYAIDPATAAVTAGYYLDLKVEKVDSHTVRVVFDKPTPFWPGIFAVAMLIPRHVFGPYSGAKSREAPANLKPVGTGPYKFVEFKPGDLVRAEINHELPRAQPAALRHRRAQGWRRCHLRRTLGASDRRVRLRLEPAGRGRTAQAHGKTAAGAASASTSVAASSTSSSIRLTPPSRPTASGRTCATSTRPSATRPCARPWGCWWTGSRCRSSSTAASAWPRPTT